MGWYNKKSFHEFTTRCTMDINWDDEGATRMNYLFNKLESMRQKF